MEIQNRHYLLEKSQTFLSIAAHSTQFWYLKINFHIYILEKRAINLHKIRIFLQLLNYASNLKDLTTLRTTRVLHIMLI